MKKYLVIGNPIEHSLSPNLHNYWIKNNNINAIYEKKKLNKEEIKILIADLKQKKINGINVTVPFKNQVIPFLDKLSSEAEKTQSVNTIYLQNGKIIGHNTDIEGFEKNIQNLRYSFVNKKVLILGSGGVVPSIIFALNNMKVLDITVCNRTKHRAENLKKLFKDINIIEWGDVPNFDIIINCTSVGLNEDEKIDLDLTKIGKNKFFYDVIYNPKETNFLKLGKKLGNDTANGKMMFIYQAAAAFKIWHGIIPEINAELLKLLD